jgi:hypothetical protein
MCKRNLLVGSAGSNGRKSGASARWRDVVLFASFVAHSFFELAIKRCRPR